jgi:membrane-associated phospholipid phosphatase
MPPELLIRLLADITIIPVVLIASGVLLFKVPKGKRWQAYSRIMMAGLTAFLIAKLLATVYQPADLRPFELMGVNPGALYLNNPGFPSDHTLLVAVLTLAVWFETRMKKITILLAILTILICIGRVLALVHTPLDVIGGVVIALIGALWYLNTNYLGGQKVKVGHGTSTHR